MNIWIQLFNMATSSKRYRNIDEILDFVTRETDSEEEKLIENDSEIDSEWEYEDEEDHVTFVSDKNVDFYSNEGDPADVAVGPAAGDDSLPPSDSEQPAGTPLDADDDYRDSEEASNDGGQSKSSDEEPKKNCIIIRGGNTAKRKWK